MEDILRLSINSFVGYVLLTIPVLHLGLSSVITEKLYIPEFIVGELSKTATTKYLLYVAFAFLFYLNLRLIYFLPLLAIKHRTVKEAVIESWQRTKGYQFSLVIRLLAVSAVTFFVFINCYFDCFSPSVFL